MANPIKLPELLGRLIKEGAIPEEIEKEVDAVRQEAQPDIKATLRNECRLQLRKPDMPSPRDESDAKPSGPSYVRIPVNVLPGCPEGVKHVEIDTSSTTIKEALLIASHREDLEKIATGGPGALALHEKLEGSSLSLINRPSLNSSSVKAITMWARACLAWLNKTAATITHRILLVDEDCMGAYHYHQPEETEETVLPVSRIELYWAVIGLVAKLHGWSVRSLAITVLTHEWAHAFTHLGLDIDEKYWSTDSFTETEKFVKEGLAQYYTHQTLASLADRNERLYGSAFLVYDRLWPKQDAAYQAHRPWIDRYKSEHVRHAMLGLRQSGEITLKEFECRLANAKNDLSGKAENNR